MLSSRLHSYLQGERKNTRLNATTAQGSLFSISGRQWLILLMVQLSNMLFGMTITLANLVLPQVRGTLSATEDEISWVITLNLVATAVATPMTGWLSSRLGWRNLMFSTVLGFTVASFLCGLANSLETLILARVAQGFFGAPIMPMGQAVLLATFPPHLQPAALMMWGVGAVFGPVAGPILGAIATDAYNWRAAFFMIVPPGICALVCIWFALAEHSKPSSIRFDWIGFGALSVAIVAAQLIFDRGQRLDWFDSSEITLQRRDWRSGVPAELPRANCGLEVSLSQGRGNTALQRQALRKVHQRRQVPFGVSLTGDNQVRGSTPLHHNIGKVDMRNLLQLPFRSIWFAARDTVESIGNGLAVPALSATMDPRADEAIGIGEAGTAE